MKILLSWNLKTLLKKKVEVSKESLRRESKKKRLNEEREGDWDEGPGRGD